MTFYDFRKFTSKSSVESIFKDFLGLAMDNLHTGQFSRHGFSDK